MPDSWPLIEIDSQTALLRNAKYLTKMLAKGLLNRYITPLKTTDFPKVGLALMDEYRVMHLPVVSQDRYMGILSEVDLLAIPEHETLESLKLSLSRPYVFNHQHFYDVVRIAAEQKLAIVPVLDLKENYQGCITTESILQEMANITSVVQPGGIIVLEMNEHDFAFSEIARIVENNDAKVLSMYVTTFAECKRMQVTLKVNKIDISPIIQTFNRYNYLIVAFFSEESKLDDLLAHRFESLMNYLNI